MLQKIVNGIAIASGVVSLAVVGTVGYVYIRKDAIIEDIKEKALEEAASILPSLLPVPQLPGLGGASAPSSEIAPPSLPFSI